VKLVGRQRTQVQVDLTPLVDVVFILLVFVMLAASFARQPAVAVALPEAHATPPTSGQTLVITIERDGRLWIDGAVVPSDALAEALTSRRSSFRGLTVRADGQVALARAVKVLDTARHAGFKRLAIATRHPTDATGPP